MALTPDPAGTKALYIPSPPAAAPVSADMQPPLCLVLLAFALHSSYAKPPDLAAAAGTL